MKEQGNLFLKDVPAGVLEKLKDGSYDEESTRDAPRMLNFEDTEEEPLMSSAESLNGVQFDKDFEQMSLY